jgi:hypothetical protein
MPGVEKPKAKVRIHGRSPEATLTGASIAKLARRLDRLEDRPESLEFDLSETDNCARGGAGMAQSLDDKFDALIGELQERGVPPRD